MKYLAVLEYIKKKHCSDYIVKPESCSICKYGVAIEALEKADKYRWHDLRKNPNDLPNEDLFFRNILVTDGTYYMIDCSVYVDDEMGCISAESEEAIMYNVIAWREIEPFEVKV